MKLNKKKKILMIIAGVTILLGIIAGVVLNKILNRITSSPSIASDSRNEEWIEDIRFLKEELPKKHKDLFFYKSREEFNEEMSSLLNNITNYTDEAIKGELVKIIVSINDSHTSVSLNNPKVYPVKFFEFKDGIYLTDASLEYKDYWGKKLISINGYTIDEVKEKLKPYIAKDNEAIFKEELSRALRNYDLLSFSEIANGENLTYKFADNEITLKPLSIDAINNTQFISQSDLINNFPMSKNNSYENYWYKYIEDKNIVYVKYNSCSNAKNYSFKDFTKDVFEVVDEKNPDKLIIDLRDNGGGNSMIFNSFLKSIKERDEMNKEGKIYAIVGRKTFSSAILNSMDLRNGTNSILVGEATGGQPNHFGEVKVIHLSNVNLDVYYSSNYFKTTDVETDSVYPDKEVVLKASSFFNGKDDFLEFIITE